jgi:nicotinamidase-related amidase
MRALVVIDAQNEFSPDGLMPVPGHADAVAAIVRRVDEARRAGEPIAWVRHHNRPGQSRRFLPGTWGAEFTPGCGPLPGSADEAEFVKEVFGAFTGSAIGPWLEARRISEVTLVGFLTHMCVSTTAREALMRGLAVAIDPDATASEALHHPLLGELSAGEARRAALLHLVDLGVELAIQPSPQVESGSPS